MFVLFWSSNQTQHCPGKDSIRSKFFVSLILERLVGCKMQTADYITYSLTNSCYRFNHCQLTVNRLAGALFRLTLS